MRIVMMGTGPFAVPTFEQLTQSDHDVLCLITQPDRPMRGKRKPPVNPMRVVAEANNLPVHTPQSINEAAAIELLTELSADLFVVCDYGQILSNEALGLARLGGINLHGSLLPKYRGSAPVQWAVYHGDATTGVSVIHMTPKLDAGPCIKVVETPIDPDENAMQLEERLSKLGVAAVIESIDMLANAAAGESLGEVQDQALATKAPRLKKTDAEIDWNKSAKQIYDQFRAFQPWPGCFTHWGRENQEPLRLIVKQMQYLADEAQQPNASPGDVLSSDTDGIKIACHSGAIVLQVLQPAGKRAMQAEELLRGYSIKPGTCFLSQTVT